jgi:MFS family permease
MSDAPTPTEATGINNTARAYLAGFTLLFCFGTIVYLIAYGKSENGLHSTAMSWAWLAILVILGGIGFGAVLPSVMSLKGSTK